MCLLVPSLLQMLGSHGDSSSSVNVKYLCEESDPPAGKLPHYLFNGDFLMLEGEHDTAH